LQVIIYMNNEYPGKRISIFVDFIKTIVVIEFIVKDVARRGPKGRDPPIE